MTMRQEARDRRAMQIEAAAIAIVEEQGYAKATMQAIARRAGASMETLYNWYGDRHGLFRAMIARNTEAGRAALIACLAGDADSRRTLILVGELMLGVVTGDRSVMLARAAAADGTGELGRLIAELGRDTMMPMMGDLFRRIAREGWLAFDDADEAAETWLALTVSNLQYRRIVCRLPQPGPDIIAARARDAIKRMERLYPPIAPPAAPQ
ncbi:TetR/AcrR family transcriptional regulator [Ruixingdingia sedimenti]|uniref:TetR/AcrR family transcriptional regulator n=1 Tax=Ruixingdingia sedimenti TaxID=3073604 RepID=A0ABU1F3D0_9RHOB|nr:TetR/AcrR family transcriptional regulator [Xinfangfangia sp. LG-4]MDR5651357.1 TetR/AcrR family transcriptional regulator [Xinfangfangia sp. LG-4]